MVGAGCHMLRRVCACKLPLQEVGILKGLNYDRNIVQFYGACIRQGSDPMLVTEFMEGARAPVVHAIRPA